MDPRTGEVQVFRRGPLRTDGNDDSILALAEDAQEHIWASLNGSGLIRLNPKTGHITPYRNNPSNPYSLSHDFVSFIHKDRKGRLWAGTTGGGLNRFEHRQNRFLHYRHDPNNEESLSHNALHDFYEDEKGIFWIATGGGGLNKMTFPDPGPPIPSFTVYTEKDGLISNTIQEILVDDRKRLWLRTPRGLSRFEPRTETFQNFHTPNGFVGTSYPDPRHIPYKKGQLFFADPKGLLSFHPDDLKKDPFPPTVVLSDFLLFNESVELRDVRPDSPLEKTIGDTDSLVLTHVDHVFSFEFSALHYADPEQNAYAYKLEGYDDDWIYTDDRKRFATYTNLDPGPYVFRVKGSNKDGLWNEEGISVRIRVLPPPWLTWWAWCLYALAFVGMAAFYLVAQRRKLEKERALVHRLRQVDKLKDEFLANTSHELRTPLNGIIGLADSLLDGIAGSLSSKARTDLSMIVASGRRLGSLVNDLLDFSHLKEGRLKLDKHTVNLFALTDVVFTISKPLIGPKYLWLVNEVPPNTMVLADEARLQQIMYNLVGNAIKFTEIGSVSVTASVIQGQVQVRVIDSGIGIPESKFQTIFHSFEQVDGSLSRRFGGTGLGLAVTKQLVALHGGDIWVESEEGKGSTFTFSLPVAGGPPVKVKPFLPNISEVHHIEPTVHKDDFHPAVEVKPPPGRFSLLIVDDEAVNRQVLINHLSPQNYHLVEASGGQEALKTMEGDTRFDLILLDVMMPRVSGYDVCRILRQTYPVQELPIIFLTAKNQVDNLVQGFGVGANDYVTKPISKDELLSRVRIHLQLLDLHRALEQKVAERTRTLKMRNRELETLDGIVKTINRELELPRVLHSILQQGLTLFPNAGKGSFLLWDPEDLHFHFAASVGHEMTTLKSLRFTRDDLIRIYFKNTKQIHRGVYLHRGFSRDIAGEKYQHLPRPQSLLVMSVVLEDDLLGLLLLENHSHTEAFDDLDAGRLDRFREHAVSAVARARFLQELQEKNEEILRTQNHLLIRDKMASLGVLASGIASEFRNPLNQIKNFADLSLGVVAELRTGLETETDPPAGDPVRGFLDQLEQHARYIDEHGRRLNGIVSDLTALTYNERGSFQVNELNPLVDKYTRVTLLGIKARESITDLCVSRNFDSSIGKIKLVPQDLSRVLLKLTQNAIEALMEKRRKNKIPFEPTIWVRTRNLGDKVEIGIKDNGIGIQPDYMDRIFNPFFTTKHTGGGNIGLGLAICYEVVVQEHGGRIHLVNNEDWTEFVLTLPK